MSAATNMKLHFRPFWANVTYSPDSPVNVPTESRSLCQSLQNARSHFYRRHIDSLQNINSIILRYHDLSNAFTNLLFRGYD